MGTHIDPEKIGLLIGPGGKTIRAIQEATGASIEVEDDGTVTVAGTVAEAAEEPLRRVEADGLRRGRPHLQGPRGQRQGFRRLHRNPPRKDGLCHISELSDQYVSSVADVCKVGDEMEVKVIAIDDQDRVKLSRKAVLREQAAAAPRRRREVASVAEEEIVGWVEQRAPP